MKMLWKLSREAIRYRGLYIIAILATLSLTMAIWLRQECFHP